MAPRVEIITDVAGFSRLRPLWNRLLRAGAASSAFLTFAWLFTWWCHLSAGRDLLIIAVWQDEKLAALAPLMRRRRSLRPLRVLPALEFLASDQVTSDYLDVIVRRGREIAARAALGGVLASRSLLVDLSLTPSGSESERLAVRLADLGWVTTTAPAGACPYVSLTGETWDSYLGGLGSSYRYNVRRRRRSLAKGFDEQIDVVTSEDQRRTTFAILVELHNLRR
jgi:CelD/BcsL family acetyltransferase involved in cellulose biosynthesis